LRNHELVACVARTQHAGLEVLMRLHLHLPSYATAALLALVTCRGDQGPEAPRQVTAGPRPSLATVANGITLVGAGNIARCDRTNDEATATLLDAIPGTVFALGDAAYPNGTTTNYTCYNASWGRHKARTSPPTGNHDYDSSATASAYFQYFGTVAGDTTKGYYSYDLGSWHIIVLSSDRQPRLRLERHRLRLLSVLRHRRGRHDQGLLQLRPRFLAHHRPQQQLQPRRHGGGLAPGALAQGGPRRRREAVRAGDVARPTILLQHLQLLHAERVGEAVLGRSLRRARHADRQRAYARLRAVRTANSGRHRGLRGGDPTVHHRHRR